MPGNRTRHTENPFLFSHNQNRYKILKTVIFEKNRKDKGKGIGGTCQQIIDILWANYLK